MNNPCDDLRRLTETVRMTGADIAPTYIEYVQLAFAIANDCGEAGRKDFLTLCSLSPKYDGKNAEQLFNGALRTGNNDIHLGSVFHLAEQCGVKIPGSSDHPDTGDTGTAGTAPDFSHTRTRYNKVENESSDGISDENPLVEGSEPYSPLPVFPQDYEWPELLDRIISYGKRPEQRDVLLLGALTGLGASLSHTVRCLYSRKWQAPCMQTFIVGPSAAGKGAMTWTRLLIEPIHDEIRRQVAEAMKKYRQEKAAYDSLGKERKNREAPVLPPNRMFLISGNNTGTGILQNIMDSDGTGIICESEADTVSAAIGSDYGNWSDTLRKAFDQDRLSYNRRTDHEYQEVEKSYLSVLLSGTPAQVKPLIPTAENGLFSRQNFYYMPHIEGWADQFGGEETDVEEEFRQMGKEWKSTLDKLKLRGMFTLRLTDAQQKEFNRIFSGLFHRSNMVNGDEMSSSVVRLAISTCRMMSVVALLRSLEDSTLARPDEHLSSDNLKDRIIPRWDMDITDGDFHAVLALVEPLYLHATHILSFLTPTVIRSRGTADRDMLFADMAQDFTRKQLLEQAKRRGIPESTALTWLKRLAKQGALTGVDGKGNYHKN